MAEMVRGLLLALGCILVWGVTFVNTKALLVEFSALEIQVLRFAFAWCLLAGFGRGPRVTWREEGVFAALGLFGVAIYQLLENCAIHYTNASNVAILVSLCPVVTALASWALGRTRRPRLWFFAGFVLAIAGVTLVSLEGVAAFHFRPAGDLMAVAAMLSWGCYTQLLRRVWKYPQAFVIRRAFGWALLFTLPIVLFGLTPAGRSFAEGSLAVTLDSARNLARFTHVWNYVNLGFLGALASAACFVAWNRACQRLGTVRCTVALYLIPAVTVLFAYAFLGERLTPLAVAGAVLTLVGTLVSGLKS